MGAPQINIDTINLDLLKIPLVQELKHNNVIMNYMGANRMKSHRILSENNISLLKGKKGVRKSTFLAVIASHFINYSDSLNFEVLQDKQLFWLDTEQGRYDCEKLVYWAHRNAGVTKKAANFEFLSLKKETNRKDKLKILVDICEQNPKSVIFIDQVRHFITSINDETASNEFVQMLNALVESNNLHILCVLHENPGKGLLKARGHVGTELEQIAETVIRIGYNREDNCSEICFEYLRDLRPKDFQWTMEDYKPIVLGEVEDKNEKPF